MITYFLCTGRWHNGSSVYQWSGRQGFNHRSSYAKDSKMVLDALLNIIIHQHGYPWLPLATFPIVHHFQLVLRAAQGKRSNPGKAVAPSSPRCCSYWKRNHRVASNYVRPTYLCIFNLVGHQVTIMRHLVRIKFTDNFLRAQLAIHYTT